MGYFYHISGVVVLFLIHLGDYRRLWVYSIENCTISRQLPAIPLLEDDDI